MALTVVYWLLCGVWVGCCLLAGVFCLLFVARVVWYVLVLVCCFMVVGCRSLFDIGCCFVVVWVLALLFVVCRSMFGGCGSLIVVRFFVCVALCVVW